ncbi:MAG: hypothetical protein AABZ77_00885 [Chloroflexota bacterium]
MNMLEELRQYYNEVGISSLDFRCKHHEECKAGAEKFTKAKAALVGKEYQSRKLPRLLFISLDSGSGDELAEPRTACEVQKQYEQSNPLGGGKNKHWYRTHELAYEILKTFGSNMTIDSVKGYFAHTNSAKCCMNKPGRRKADRKLFTNCKEYIPDEVRILKPDIIITQGNEAKYSITGVFPILELENFISIEKWKPSYYREVTAISISDVPVLWIRTYHPGCYGLFNKHTRARVGDYSQISHEFHRNF